MSCRINLQSNGREGKVEFRLDDGDGDDDSGGEPVDVVDGGLRMKKVQGSEASYSSAGADIKMDHDDDGDFSIDSSNEEDDRLNLAAGGFSDIESAEDDDDDDDDIELNGQLAFRIAEIQQRLDQLEKEIDQLRRQIIAI